MSNTLPGGEFDAPIVNFGNLPPLPDGYCVRWHDNLEHYIGWGPGYESPITWDRFQARRWCVLHGGEVEDE